MSGIELVPNKYLKRDEKSVRTFEGVTMRRWALKTEQREHFKVSVVKRAGEMLHLCSISPMLPASETIREGC